MENIKINNTGLTQEELVFTNSNVKGENNGNHFFITGTEEELKHYATKIYNLIENNNHPESYEWCEKQLSNSGDDGLRPEGFAISFVKKNNKKVLFIDSRNSRDQKDQLLRLKDIIEKATK